MRFFALWPRDLLIKEISMWYQKLYKIVLRFSNRGFLLYTYRVDDGIWDGNPMEISNHETLGIPNDNGIPR